MDEGQEKKQLSDAHRLVGYWAAHGYDAKRIAKELDYSESTVKALLRQKEVQFFIKKVRHKLYGEDAALHIRDCAKRGVEVASEIMENKKVKPHTRLVAAQDFMDRAYGKPETKLNLGEGTVRQLLSIIQNQAVQKPIDTKDVTPNNDIEDAQYTEVHEEPVQIQEAPKDSDDIDSWIDKNFK